MDRIISFRFKRKNKGFDDDEKSKNKDTYVLIRPTLSDTYGNGLIDGILEWGTLKK